MLSQVIFLYESFGADLALEWSIASVNTFVNRQLTLPNKGSWALRTFVWSHFSVGRHFMTLAICRMTIAIATVSTLERFLTRMIPYMQD